MSVRRPMVLAFVLVACVLYVFVSPAFNLPQTALRAQQNALRVLMGMVVVAFALVLTVVMRHALTTPAVPPLVSESVVDLTCTRRC